MAFAWRLWAIGLLLTGTLLAALGATLSVLSVAVSFALLLGAIAFFVGGAMAHRRAKGATEKAKGATFSAWESVAEEVLKARGGKVSARELAKELATSEEDVERMMTFLSADDRADVSLREAEVVYSARIPLRVDASALEEAGAAVAEREGDEETDGTSGRAASADERRR